MLRADPLTTITLALLLALPLTALAQPPYESDAEGPALPAGMTLDEVLDQAAQTPPEDHPNPVPEDQLFVFLLGDQLGYRFAPGDGHDQIGAELLGWFGDDFNRLWLKFEGEASWGGDAFEGETETDLLYGRLITPFWNIQAGLQYANGWSGDDYEDTWAGALAFQGVAPGKFEVDASLYLTEDLNLLASLELEYDIRVTQRLVLQPRAELSFAAQDMPERHVGAGLTRVVTDLRLRYEFLRELAPYLGARYWTLFGETAERAADASEATRQLLFVAGLRFAIY